MKQPPKRYEFSHINDLLTLTEEQFERFLPDLMNWHKYHSKIKQKMQERVNQCGITATVTTASKGLVWVDDGKNEMSASISEIYLKQEKSNE